MNRQEALKMIKLALATDNVRDAYAALGYCKCVLETEEANGDEASKAEMSVEPEAPKQEVAKTEMSVEPEAPKPTFQEYCEAEAQKLKRDIIAEEEKTYYLNRAYLKDEICKRWPTTNLTIKKILHAKGIRNIEEFYNYFLNPAHWEFDSSWGLAPSDMTKLRQLFLTLNEESGCLASDKLLAYMPVDSNRGGAATKMVAHLGSLCIATKSQLRYYVQNVGNVSYVKGVDNKRIDALNAKVKEELALHMI